MQLQQVVRVGDRPDQLVLQVADSPHECWSRPLHLVRCWAKQGVRIHAAHAEAAGTCTANALHHTQLATTKYYVTLWTGWGELQ